MKTIFKRVNKKLLLIGLIFVLAALVFPYIVSATTDGVEYQSNVYATAWALVPPVVAIILAFLTKEVYSSLFAGVFIGALMYANYDILHAVETTVVIIRDELGANGGLLVFLVELGIIVAMMQLSGCTRVFADWATKRIKTRRGAMLATTGLGLFLFIDDYFNCLTTGSIMRPVTDKHNISRARLAYNIDCTAAPLCIIAPISTWAAAVSSNIPNESGIDGFLLFIQTIPYNFYALLTLVMLIVLALLQFDFGPMRKYEKMAIENGDIYGGTGNLYAEFAETSENPKGKVIDMILPVLVLIIGSIVGLLYSGGFFSGASVVESFSNCDAFIGLPIGGFFALIFTVALYLIRKVVSFKEFTECITKGFEVMVPAMLILVFSWALSTVCRSQLGATEFVREFMKTSSFNMNFLPFILYVIGTFVSFSTGTSWGTFGILIPIVVAIFGEVNTLMVISMAGALAGAVTGDHCSPISETAIMSSTAAQVDFMQHVMTQLPYAMFVAGLSGIGFLLAGFIQNAFIVLAIMIVLTVVTLIAIKKYLEKKEAV